ncbi:hypothetical protein AB0P36_26330 [Streptomyces flavidovirens]|uniref:hypothetical protein n=1 Tax=Streptomyces flavidovirens TaxID=67298 RepID=UPI0034458CF4
MRRRTIGPVLRTRGRGRVWVEEDERGHQWVTCSGCRMDAYAPGVSPAKFQARQHADTCDR